MKKLLATAVALTLLSLYASAGGRAPQTVAKMATGVPADYQEMLDRYCITCHNQKARIPAGAPLALDAANLQDVGADAAIWEKVVRKLGVGAMPPQGSPRPAGSCSFVTPG